MSRFFDVFGVVLAHNQVIRKAVCVRRSSLRNARRPDTRAICFCGGCYEGVVSVAQRTGNLAFRTLY